MNSSSGMLDATPGCGDFSLIDHFNQAVTNKTLRDRHTLVLFGFTHCRMVCPLALQRYSGVLEQLAAEGCPVRGIYISVDPARDTPEVLRHYLQPYPAFVGLTGDAAQVDQAKAAFRVFARRASDPDEPDGYRVPHTAIAYFLGEDGLCLAHFADALCAEQVLGRMRPLLATQIRQSGS